MSTTNNENINILSPREKEVALLIAEGVKNNDIAKKLSIKSNTVSTIKKNIFVKLNIESVVGLYKIINS
jgi:DNA-binding NarL/FixJ family response regulator